MEILILLLGILLTLLAFAFLNGAEIAFTGLGRAHVLLWLKEGRLGARLTARWHDRPDPLLITLLSGANLAAITCTTLATLLGLALGWPEWAAALGVSLLLTVVGESLPKTLSHGWSHHLFPRLALPLRVVHLLLWPVVAPISLLFRLLPARTEHRVLQLRAHLRHLSEDLGEAGHLGRQESRMIRRALELRERRLGDLMTPRTDLSALPLDASIAEAARLIVSGGKSSLPLYVGDLDHIVGYVTARDFFSQPSALQEIRREPLFVPVSMRARDLLASFGGGQARLAVVLDEYGGTAGLLTLEDLLEDLVGAIQDEHDQDRREWIPLADGRWFVPARLRLESLAEHTGIVLDSETADTLGGWVVEQLGRIPAEGERLDLPPLLVSVVSASPRHLRHLIVQVGRHPAGEEGGNERRPLHASTSPPPSFE